MNVFCVRPRRFNVGNESINLATRLLLREAFDGPLNLVNVPAQVSEEEGSLSGMTAGTIHEMNLYGQGVVIGGGNLYENGQIDLDLDALACLRPPLLLMSLSYGRIFDARGSLRRRTDALPDASVQALERAAMRSVARDRATQEHLEALGVHGAQVGACPTLLLGKLLAGATLPAPPSPAPVLISIRNPRLMSVPLADQARVLGAVNDLIVGLERRGLGPVTLLCHDKRDLAFASSFGDVPYVIPDDAYSCLALLQAARLVVSFRLHAFVPCLALGTPTVNVSYDERSASLVETIGLEDWDVPFLREPDLAGAVLERVDRLDDLRGLVELAQPLWEDHERTLRAATTDFAAAVRSYAATG